MSSSSIPQERLSAHVRTGSCGDFQKRLRRRTISTTSTVYRRRRSNVGSRDFFTGDVGRWEIRLKEAYGLSADQYEQMWDAQAGCCAVCRKYIPYKLAVDHCHDTRKIRGLLCTTCNMGLGAFHDDPTVLRRAALYIEGEGQCNKPWYAPIKQHRTRKETKKRCTISNA